MTGQFTYYIEANIVCVILFFIMLAHDLLNIDRQEKQIKFDHALIAFMLYFISDSLWAAVVDGLLPKNLFTVLSTNFANYVLMASITYMWLRFVLAVEQTPDREKPLFKFLMLLPFLLSTVILVVTYMINPHLLVNEALELQPAYNPFQVAVPYIYIAAVIIYTSIRAKSEENPIEKRKHLYIGLFPLMVVAGGLVQMLVSPSTPIFCFACTILMHMFYIHSMETQISTDPLTQLNNRGQLLRYSAQKAYLRREGRLTFVIMFDINDFKTINDTYGHAEGDRALIIVADSLRTVQKRHNTPMFLARYGGDEFIIIIHPVHREDVDSLIREIREQIINICRAEETPYLLSIGAGYAELTDTFQKCMLNADQKLYEDKAYQKSHPTL